MSDVIRDGPGPEAAAELRAKFEQALEDRDLEGASTALRRLAAAAPGADDLPALHRRMEEAQRVVVQEAVADAELHLAQGRPRRALDGLTRIAWIASRDAQVARLLGEAQAAVNELDAQLRARPMVDRARKFAVQGRLDEALKTVEEAVRLAPDDARALRLRDELIAQAGAARRTAAAAAPARPATPPSAAESAIRTQVRQLLAAARGSLERHDVAAAERDTQKALALAPADPDAAALLAEIRERRGELDRRQRLDTLAADAARLFEAGRFQACLALVAELAKLDPSHPAVDDLRARAEAAHAETETRRTTVRSTLAEGQEALARGDVARAVEHLSTVLAQDPTHAEARRALGEARARLAQRERIAALLASARGQLERDEIETAQRDVQAALRLDPDDLNAQALWDRLLARLKELRSAKPEDAPRPVAAPPPAAPPTPAAPAAPRVPPEPPPLPRPPVHEPVAPARTGPPETRPGDPSETELREIVEATERLIREGRPDRALQTLRDLFARMPGRTVPPELARLQANAERAATEQTVRARVRPLIQRAMRLSLEGKLDEALAAAEEAVALAPDDARALRLRDDLADRLR